jgi:ABC-type bacteriocin/lantibiotic exporter with double-glycine peptidase domain
MRLNTGNVKLLIADEPSAAMDPAGEFELFNHLREARYGKTMIFITHRFGHLTKHADLILCMKDGQLVEQGTHAELVARKGEYFDLYNVQAQAFAAEVETTGTLVEMKDEEAV